MIEITYGGLFIFITMVWIAVRVICAMRKRVVDGKYEAKLLTVFICLVVIARFVYFPLDLVDGRIASLYLDFDKVFPFWINLVPIVHMFDEYDGWLINIIGNIAMFIPVGIVWPYCFKKLNTIGKTVLVGGELSLCIEKQLCYFYTKRKLSSHKNCLTNGI